jgi:putative ABC transport system permease protein
MLFSYTLSTLWHERHRFLSGVVAVAFSAVLITLQTGLLWGLFATTSAPIDNAEADIWLGAPRVLSVDLGRAISENHLSRLGNQPGILHPELYILDYAYWVKSNGSKELCIVIGSRLSPHSLGSVKQLTPQLRARLSEPGSVVIDETEKSRLGVSRVGDTAEIMGHRVRVVGFVRGLKSLTGPYIFCSIETAHKLLPLLPDQTTYILARCRNPWEAPHVAQRLRAQHPDISVFTRDEISLRTRMYWLTMTNAGISAGFTAVLGLLVGAVVTSQTLYAATVASLREFAVLRALGIPRWRIGLAVVVLSFWVGVIGIAVALPANYALANVATVVGTRVLLPMWLIVSASAITLVMAVLSGLAALRSLRLMEPAALLR